MSSSHEADHQIIRQLTRIADALEKIDERSDREETKAEERRIAKLANAAGMVPRHWMLP